jgi:hypothetical protein
MTITIRAPRTCFMNGILTEPVTAPICILRLRVNTMGTLVVWPGANGTLVCVGTYRFTTVETWIRSGQRNYLENHCRRSALEATQGRTTARAQSPPEIRSRSLAVPEPWP